MSKTIRIPISGDMINQPIILVPVCFEGKINKLRIYSKPGVNGFCSIFTGIPGSYASLVAECKGQIQSGESQELSESIIGYQGIHILCDSNVLSILVDVEAIV